MPSDTTRSMQERLNNLEAHLGEENPALKDAVGSFRKLDDVAQRLGIFGRDDSFATQVSWWPLISVLGTFSSGKSTFINRYLNQPLQATGNQAVDDKFTVICYGREEQPRVLPGRALDNEPRFPFFRISDTIDETIEGEGRRLDVYLQLKTCNSEKLRGQVLIDSPGFDADAQRTATLRITEHIIDLSDLVLVFFDARHPEPGAMRDTLDHLVTRTLARPDFNKFVFVLNQIDSAVREDNPEEVFAAWQRALAQKGLTAGRFFRIYDAEAAPPIADETLRRRFETKRDADLGAIMQRIEQVNVERAYRVTGTLEETANTIGERLLPRLSEARRRWKKRVLWTDGVLLGGGLLALVGASAAAGWWTGLRFTPPWGDSFTNPIAFWGLIIALLVVGWQIHRRVRRSAGRRVLEALRREQALGSRTEWLCNAFEANVTSKRPFFLATPKGDGRAVRTTLQAVIGDANRLVQSLNDRFTNPAGRADVPPAAAEAEEAQRASAAPAATTEEARETAPADRQAAS